MILRIAFLPARVDPRVCGVAFCLFVVELDI